MKKLFCLLTLVVVCPVLAQIYVSPNSYVYNKGNVVFSTGNLELNGASSTFYLRNQGQFLQGTTGTSTNKGVGKLSVFQEGTVNNYAYNYWCSPVGNASATTGNEAFGITMLNLPSTTSVSAPATITSSSYDGESSNGSVSIASYWIWKFLSSSTYSQWYQSAANTDIQPGEGFTMKGTWGNDATNVGETTVNNPGSAQRYDFRGKPNDGTITVTVGLNNFTLTGNPYPSALHVNAFLLDASNSASTGIAYYWEQDKSVNSHLLLSYQGGYGTYSPVSLASNGIYVPATFNTYNIDGTLNTTGSSSGLSIERKYAPIGQGFMVKGNSNGTLTLKNSHRAYNKEGSFSQFEKMSSGQTAMSASDAMDVSSDAGIITIPQIRLNTIINNTYTKQIALAFVPQATDGIDRGIDARSASENDPNEVYFVLDNDRYVIQGLKFDVNKRIPVGVKSTNNNQFKFDASTIANFDSNQPIYMYDALDGSYHDIKSATYEVSLPTGVYDNRFEITFTTAALGVSAAESSLSNVVVVHNNAQQILTVVNPNRIPLQSLKLCDLNGKKLFNHQKLGAQDSYQFSTSGLSDAVYVVELLTTDNQKLTQKIIVSLK